METIKVPLNEDIKNCPPLQPRVKLRLMSADMVRSLRQSEEGL